MVTKYNTIDSMHTDITRTGNTYKAAKLIESKIFELNNVLFKIQISSVNPLLCSFVTVRLNINFGIEYKADVIQTATITI